MQANPDTRGENASGLTNIVCLFMGAGISGENGDGGGVSTSRWGQGTGPWGQDR